MSERDYDAFFAAHAIRPTGVLATPAGPAVVRPALGTMVLEAVIAPRAELEELKQATLVAGASLDIRSVTRRDGTPAALHRQELDTFMLHGRTPADAKPGEAPWFEWPKDGKVLWGIRAFSFDPPTKFEEMATLAGTFSIVLPRDTVFIEVPTDGSEVSHGERTLRALAMSQNEVALEVKGVQASRYAGVWAYRQDGEFMETGVRLERMDERAMRVNVRCFPGPCGRQLVVGLPGGVYQRSYDFTIDMTKAP